MNLQNLNSYFLFLIDYQIFNTTTTVLITMLILIWSEIKKHFALELVFVIFMLGIIVWLESSTISLGIVQPFVLPQYQSMVEMITSLNLYLLLIISVVLCLALANFLKHNKKISDSFMIFFAIFYAITKTIITAFAISSAF